jgi:hypothetical protein
MTLLKGIEMLTQEYWYLPSKMYRGTNIRDTRSFTASSGMPKLRQNARTTFWNLKNFPGGYTPDQSPATAKAGLALQIH